MSLWGPWLALAIAGAAAGGGADADGRLALDPNIRIDDCGAGPGLSLGAGLASRTVSGEFEGLNDGYTTFGSYCTGYFDTADACVFIRSHGRYAFEITDGGGSDTTLGLYGGDLEAPFCDDDGGNGLLSRLEVWLEPGQYEIWIGSFSSGVSGPFVLTAQYVGS